jgi:hypothetical protein
VNDKQRAAQIRRELRREYSQGAVNELYVARLMNEMTSLPHRHVMGHFDTCGFCFFGQDEQFMSWEQIEREVREREAVSDALIERIVFKSHVREQF